MNLEYRAVRAQLSDITAHTHPMGTRFEVGHLDRCRAALALTGKGNQSAAVLTERAAAEFAPAAPSSSASRCATGAGSQPPGGYHQQPGTLSAAQPGDGHPPAAGTYHRLCWVLDKQPARELLVHAVLASPVDGLSPLDLHIVPDILQHPGREINVPRRAALRDRRGQPRPGRSAPRPPAGAAHAATTRSAR